MSYQCISSQQALELLREADACVVDIRDAASFAQGHIPGARHVDGSTIGAVMEAANPDAPLIVCCYHGISSRSAAEFFAGRGFRRVFSLDGGYEGWRATQG